MALVHLEGFEALSMLNASLTRNYLSSSELASVAGLYSASSSTYYIPPTRPGINGGLSLRLTSLTTFTGDLPISLSSGIFSFLGNHDLSTNPRSGDLWFSLDGAGSSLVSVRVVSSTNAFPNLGNTMELFVGGVQVGTFFMGYFYADTWARWTLVWDTSGPNVTAALYRNGNLVMEGEGGTTGSGVPVDAYTLCGFRTPRAEFDSLTFWDDTSGDLANALQQHWVSVAPVQNPSGTSLGDYSTYGSGNFDFGYSIGNSSWGYGIRTTVSSGTVDVPLSLPPLSGITDVWGLKAQAVIQGDVLTTASMSVVSNTTASPATVESVSGWTWVSNFVATDPATGSAWSLPTTTLLIDPAGDGGFASGSTFAANGWQVSNHSSDVGWFLGPLGALEGERGAYASVDGGVTESLLNAPYVVSYLWRDITIPPGVTMISISVKARGLQSSGVANNSGFGALLVPTSVTPVGGDSSVKDAYYTRQEEIRTQLSQYAYTLTGFGSYFWSVWGPGYSRSLSDGRVVYSEAVPVTGGNTYRLVFWLQTQNVSLSQGLALDSISVQGHSGSLTDTYLRFTAT